jgi:hypothetical protein
VSGVRQQRERICEQAADDFDNEENRRDSERRPQSTHWSRVIVLVGGICYPPGVWMMVMMVAPRTVRVRMTHRA